MVWGYFDQYFLLSLLWWFLYTGALYVAIREYMFNIDSYIKVFGQAILFGSAATLLKTGIDALTEMFALKSGNMMITVFIMELVLLLFGCAVMVLFRRSGGGWRRTGPAESLYKVCP